MIFNDLNNISDHTLISELDLQGFELVEALAYDASIDRYYGSATNQPFRSQLNIDPTTGIATRIGPFDIGNDAIEGLAVTPVPLPTSISLLSFGLAAFAYTRRNAA